jgi:ribosome biogenesis GTPase
MKMIELKNLGWDESRQNELEEINTENLFPARVASTTTGRYLLLGIGEAGWAVLRGKLIDSDSPDELPAVGDWVLARKEQETLVIEEVLSRRSRFVRKAAGISSKTQVIATNVDRVFIVTTIGEDFSPRRIERYLTAVWDGGSDPVIVVNKIDRPHDREEIQGQIDSVAFGVASLFVSAHTGEGLDELFALCEAGKTIALVGSSGVGKSTLINRLLGSFDLETSEVREKDEKGRYTITRKEMIPTA